METGNLTISFGVIRFIEDFGLDLYSALSLSRGFVTFSLVSTTIATILLSFILGYLGSIEDVRRGVLLYMYKDIVSIFLFIQWTWFAIVLTCFINGNGPIINTMMAKISSYSLTFFLIQLLVFLNILSMFKLYMSKEMILDPPLPWENADNRDPKAVGKIRLTCVSLGFLIILIMVTSEAYPQFYYYMIGDYETMNGWPIGSTIILVIYVILTSIYVITTIATEIYQKREEPFETEPNFLRQFQIIPRMFVIVLSMVLYCYVYYNMFRNGQLWFVSQLLLTLTGVLSPTFIITNTELLKNYVHQILENQLEHLRNISNLSILRSSRVQPIEIND